MTKLQEIEKGFDEKFKRTVCNCVLENHKDSELCPSRTSCYRFSPEEIKSFYRQAITSLIEELEGKIKADLLAIAEKGEYEELRREVENYFGK